MKPKTYNDILADYEKKFGEPPEFKGNFWDAPDNGKQIEMMLDAIESGVPYKENDIPNGAVL